jgi:hypothetical protein
MRRLQALWEDDCGAGLVSSELLFLYSLLVLGGVGGLVAMRQALLSEWSETAQSLLGLNQSFSFTGQAGCEASTAGSAAGDTSDTITLSRAAASGAALSQTPMD